jgi:hypothetical protein
MVWSGCGFVSAPSRGEIVAATGAICFTPAVCPPKRPAATDGRRRCAEAAHANVPAGTFVIFVAFILAPAIAAAQTPVAVAPPCRAGLPASGQDISYGNGSDGDLQAGATLYYRDNGDGTITDLTTGLMWEKKAAYDNADALCRSIEACPDPHDADNRYFWTTSGERFDGPLRTVFLEQLNNRCSRAPTVACAADDDCTESGGPCGFAGHRDWRIPNWRELLSIVDFGEVTPTVHAAFDHACSRSSTVAEGSCTVPNVYWTSNTFGENPGWAGYVSFYDGNLYADTKHHAFFARAVRDAAPGAAADGCVKGLSATGDARSFGPGTDGEARIGAALRYRDNGDGTFTDETTGLTWQKKSGYDGNPIDCGNVRQCPNPHEVDHRYSWGSGASFDGSLAMVFLEQLNHHCHANPTLRCDADADCRDFGGKCGFTGHRDWRIPNVKELHSIISYERQGPAVAAALNDRCDRSCNIFNCNCTAPAEHWSSTTYPGEPTWAVFVGFHDGNIFADDKTTFRHARAVRGGS